MNELTALTNINIITVLQGIFIIIAFVVASVTLLDKFFKIIGKPIKWLNKANKDHELLQQTIKNFDELHKKHDADMEYTRNNDDKLNEKLEKLTQLFVNKEINDFRWEIIKFAEQIAEKKHCNKESYQHCFKTYQQYEQILEEYGLENGEVELSMEIINESYKQKLANGDFK